MRGAIGVVRGVAFSRGGEGEGPIDKLHVDDGALSTEMGEGVSYPCAVSLRPMYRSVWNKAQGVDEFIRRCCVGWMRFVMFPIG